MLIIISAKDYRSKISIPKIDELWGVMQDVQATRGILLCNGGFTAQTKIYARNLGIDLCTLTHLDNLKREELINIPLIFVYYENVKINAQFQIIADEGIVLKGEEAFKRKMYSDGKNIYQDMFSMFEFKWNNNELDKTVGNREVLIDPFYVLVDEYQSPQNPFTIQYTVKKRGKIEFVPLEEYYKLEHYTKEQKDEFVKVKFTISNPKKWSVLERIDDIETKYPGLHIVFAINETLNKENLTESNSTLEEVN